MSAESVFYISRFATVIFPCDLALQYVHKMHVDKTKKGAASIETALGRGGRITSLSVGDPVVGRIKRKMQIAFVDQAFFV